jgi:hypothetical protein
MDRSTTDYTAFVHLIDENGQILAQQDAPPGGVDNPTRFWIPGEIVRSTYLIDLPQDAATAKLGLRIGLYEPVSGRQLPVTATSDPSLAERGATYVLTPILN